MSKVLYCHDNFLFAQTQQEILERFYGHRVVICTNAQSSLDRVRRGLSDFDVVIVHKDLGLGIEEVDSEIVVGEIHASAPHIRIGIVSGEFPDGHNHVINSLQADFYMLTGDNVWWLTQVDLGPVSPQEMSKRGISVEMSPTSLGIRERH